MSASSVVPELDSTRFQSEVLGSPVPVLVDFHATWCGPCRALAPQLDRLATELGPAAKVVKVDIDGSPELAEAHRVQAVPTLLVFSGGQEVARQVGGGDLGGIARALAQATTGAARGA